MTALVRSASLTGFIEVATSCGLDPHALAAEVGLPRRCLDEPDLMIPTQPVGQLLELAAARGREPAFGLRMAESRRLSNLGPLGLLVRDERTLRDALEVLVTHIHMHNEALSVRVEQVGNLVSIRVEMGASPGTFRQASELVVGVTFRVLSVFMGAGWQPRLVCFTHRAPADLRVHRRVFGRAVEFGHEFDGIVCNASDLDVPNPGADPVMVRYARRLLEQSPGKRPRDSARVRELVVVLLPRGHCRVEVVAQHMGMDRRTLARRLAAEGTTFSAVVDKVRRDLLGGYLKDGARPLAEVSDLLGFSAPSAFSRWHRNQFGIAARSRVNQP
ncbi:AraC family transcriptional regulator [Variovorax sp. YR216]|uniref:AraC family transcriptional regulator n=1 Tax=Variovorax sp. YR216 TaxID=1882828 RepID=UPI0008993E3A|nr:AraC family transcriptional regulator [Variovorax sp. YR216]SEB22032.1 AraC-type DNA-binding protein [Variovorax sp. YR216]